MHLFLRIVLLRTIMFLSFKHYSFWSVNYYKCRIRPKFFKMVMEMPQRFAGKALIRIGISPSFFFILRFFLQVFHETIAPAPNRQTIKGFKILFYVLCSLLFASTHAITITQTTLSCPSLLWSGTWKIIMFQSLFIISCFAVDTVFWYFQCLFHLCLYEPYFIAYCCFPNYSTYWWWSSIQNIKLYYYFLVSLKHFNFKYGR